MCFGISLFILGPVNVIILLPKKPFLFYIGWFLLNVDDNYFFD